MPPGLAPAEKPGMLPLMANPDSPTQPWWESTPLNRLSTEQWEALCDGCGRCCLHKLEDEDDGTVHATDVACRLLDLQTCRCSRYDQRRQQVPDCLSVRGIIERDQSHTLPPSCAYRRLAEGRPLAEWHPLISGRSDSVHRAGVSVRGRVLPESAVHGDDLEHRLVEWPMQDPDPGA